MSFSWNTLYRNLKLNSNNPSRRPEEWSNALRSIEDKELSIASYLLTLAFFDGINAGGYGEGVSQIDELAGTIGIHYNAFSRNRGRLLSGLQKHYDVKLLFNSANHAQYLRTIRRYSGAMYVYFAKLVAEKIRELSPEKCTDYNTLKNLFISRIHLFAGNDQEEQDSLLDDIILFFKSLIDSYCQYHIFFTAEDIRKIAQNKIQIPIANRIYEQMLQAVDGVQDLNRLVTRPQIALSHEGKAVFVLPDEGCFSSEINDNAIAVGFEFVLKNGKTTLFRYVKDHDTFILRRDNNAWPEISLTEKVLLRFCSNTGEMSEPEDVSMQGNGIVLLCTRNSQEVECGFVQDISNGNEGIIQNNSCKLWVNGKFKVVNFSNNEVAITATSGEAKDTPIELDKYGCFVVPPDSVSVTIDDIVFEVKNAVDKYLDLDMKLDCFEKAGGRLFFTHKPCPLLLDNLNNLESITVEYLIPNKEHSVVDIFGDGWNIPDECLWTRGSLVIRQNDNVLLKRAITFIPSIDFEELEKNIDISETTNININIGDDSIPVEVKAKQEKIHLEYKGFHLFFRLQRTGVFLKVNEEIIPLLTEHPGNSPVIQLTTTDFKNMRCRLCKENNRNPVLFMRDNNMPVFLHTEEYSGCQLDENLTKKSEDPKNECSIYTFIFVEGIENQPRITSVYKFQIYDPKNTPVPLDYESHFIQQRGLSSAEDSTSHQAPMLKKRINNDLLLTYFIPYYHRNYHKKLLFFPAHKQDSQPECVEISEDSVLHTQDEVGRCIENILVKDFFAPNNNIDWGKGLICYIVRPQKNGSNNEISYELMTTGFFIKAPEELETPIENDDPYGLRKAFALADHEAIDRITNTNDIEKRNWIRTYYDNIQNVSKRIKGGDKYLNAFRNCIRKRNGDLLDISGYVFSAGWYSKELFEDENRRVNYIHQWSNLLIPYSDYPIENITIKPLNNDIYTILTTFLCETDKKRLYAIVKSKLGYRPNNKDFPFIVQIDSLSFPQLVESICKKHREGVTLDHLNDQMNQLSKQDPQHPCSESVYTLLQLIYQQWEDYDNGKLSIQDIASVKSEAWQFFRQQHPRGQLDIMHKFRKFFKDYKDMPCRLYGGYDYNSPEYGGNPSVYDSHPSFLGKDDIKNFLIVISKELHNWRKEPTLKAAQELREILIFLKEIDDTLARSIHLSDEAIDDTSLLKLNIDNTSFLNWIDTVSKLLWDAEFKH